MEGFLWNGSSRFRGTWVGLFPPTKKRETENRHLKMEKARQDMKNPSTALKG